MLEHLELGGGDQDTRMDFVSMCGALRIWRHLRTFRYNGVLSRAVESASSTRSRANTEMGLTNSLRFTFLAMFCPRK